MKASASRNFDCVGIGIPLAIVVMVSVSFLGDTDWAIKVSEKVVTQITHNFGTLILWFAFGLLLISAFLIFTKYGDIRMGNERPEYSTLSYTIMMALAGLGSGTIYWSFLEWSYYIKSPPFGVAADSVAAYEWAVTYSMHHWGWLAWAIYAVPSIPIMYSFYIRKGGSLKMGDVVRRMIDNQAIGGLLGRIIDIAYPIAVVFGLIIVLALGVPVIAAAVSLLTGVANTLAVKLTVLAVVAAVLVLSSFLGLDRGMQKVASYGAYFVIGLVGYILLFGPTRFILENVSSSVALWSQNFIMMSLYADAIGQDKFPQSWTSYFWAYWMIFIPQMCVFVTKVSRGRTIREVLLCMMCGGTAGTALLFGIAGSFMMKAQLEGNLDICAMVIDGQASQSIAQALSTLPFSWVVLLVFVCATVLLLVTTLDGSTFAVACQTQKKLDRDSNPSISLKIFWCLVIVTIPAVFIAVKAPVSSMQSAILIFALPLMLLTGFMLHRTFTYMRQDYGHLSAQQIQEMHKLEPRAQVSQPTQGPAGELASEPVA